MSIFSTNAIRLLLDQERTRRGIETAADLADKAGIKPANLSAILQPGGRPLTAKVAGRLAEALEITIDEFYAKLAALEYGLLRDQLRSSYSGLVPAGDEYHAVAQGHVDSLEDGDSYVLVTSERPTEFSDTALSTTLLRAAAARAINFRYVFPDFGSKVDTVNDELATYISQFGAIRLADQFEFWRRSLERQAKSESLRVDCVNQFQATSIPISGKLTFFLSPFVNYLVLGKKGLPTEAWAEVHYQCDIRPYSCFVRLQPEAANLIWGWYRDCSSVSAN